MAALLHDIGMLKIPSTLYLSEDKLSPQDRKTTMAHTILGYRILKNVSVSENVALAALEHQEKIDGSGYPKRLTGDMISTYARIVCVANSYDAIVSPRPFKERKDGHRALLALLKTDRAAYDQKILMALTYSVSLYPLGTYVVLNNNARGIVYRVNPKNPQEPIVKVTEKQNGERLKEPLLVRLSKEKVCPHSGIG